MVRVEHICVVAEQHAFDSLGDHADARLVHVARRLGRCVPPRKRHARDRGHKQTLLVGPAGNALSQRGERHVHAVLLTRLLDGLLTHSYLLSHITSPRVAGQPHDRRVRTIRQEIRRIGLPAWVRAGGTIGSSTSRLEQALSQISIRAWASEVRAPSLGFPPLLVPARQQE